ncbi:MAG: hypothetical protein MUP63_01555 [Candidatus Nanohaloarchaeota archaeon QJJ-7]|nr:hypothetical protein [Candidatus Nanohaloarchaeota archaeon QJJ-7]
MRKVADRFHTNMELEPEESFKAFLFIVKSLAAIGFLFVLGQVSVLGEITRIAALILVLSAVLDLVPEAFTFRMMRVIPEKAREAEKLQLILKVFAYFMLLSIFFGLAVEVFWAYSAFMILWLASFVVEESVMFLLEETDSR